MRFDHGRRASRGRRAGVVPRVFLAAAVQHAGDEPRWARPGFGPIPAGQCTASPQPAERSDAMPTIYEKRTYSVTVGQIPEVIRLYSTLGWPALRSGQLPRRRSATSPATPSRLHQLICGASTATTSAAPSGKRLSEYADFGALRDAVAAAAQDAEQPTPARRALGYASLRAHWAGSRDAHSAGHGAQPMTQARRGRIPSTFAFAATLAALLLLAAGDAAALRSGPLRGEPANLVVIHSTGGPTCDPRTGRSRSGWAPARWKRTCGTSRRIRSSASTT